MKGDDFTLYVFAFDDFCYEIVNKVSLCNVVVPLATMNSNRAIDM